MNIWGCGQKVGHKLKEFKFMYDLKTIKSVKNIETI